MMSKRRKEGKIPRNEMTNIDEVCFVKNAIMKII